MTQDEKLKLAIGGMVDARLLDEKLLLHVTKKDGKRKIKHVWRLYRVKKSPAKWTEIARWGIHAAIGGAPMAYIEYEEALKYLNKYKKHLREVANGY